MTYIRHRDRMVQESVFEDLVNTLIACRWLAGTTTRPVVSPYDRAAGYQVVTTSENQVLQLVGKDAGGQRALITVLDYFPDAGINDDGEGPKVGDTESGTTRLNTLAMDDGQTGDPMPLELGSNLLEQPYVFHLAFFANSDAVAKAVFNDLRDRYRGSIVSGDFVHLYDFNTDPDTPVLRMEVDGFQYTRDVSGVAQVAEAHMFFAQFVVTDVVDDVDLIPPPPPPPVPYPSATSFPGAAVFPGA